MAVAKTPQLNRYINNYIIKPLYNLGYIHISGTYNRDYLRYVTDIDIMIKSKHKINITTHLQDYLNQIYSSLSSTKNIILSLEYPNNHDIANSIISSISTSANNYNATLSIRDLDLKTKWTTVTNVTNPPLYDLDTIITESRVFVITYLAPIPNNKFIKVEASFTIQPSITPSKSKAKPKTKTKPKPKTNTNIDEKSWIRCSRSRSYAKTDILKAYKRLYSCYVILDKRTYTSNNTKLRQQITTDMNAIISINTKYQILMSAIEQLDVVLNLTTLKHPSASDQYRRSVNGAIINQIRQLHLSIHLDTSPKLTPAYIDKLRNQLHLELYKRHKSHYVALLNSYQNMTHTITSKGNTDNKTLTNTKKHKYTTHSNTKPKTKTKKSKPTASI